MGRPLHSVSLLIFPIQMKQSDFRQLRQMLSKTSFCPRRIHMT